jgi:hypothetical protein
MRQIACYVLPFLVWIFMATACSDEPGDEGALRSKTVIFPSGEAFVFTENRALFELEPRVLYYGDTYQNIYRMVSRDFRLVDVVNDWFFASTNKYMNGRFFCLEPRLVAEIQKIYDLMAPVYRDRFPKRSEENRTSFVSDTFRDPVYNNYVGGVEDSEHLIGCAVDIRLPSDETEARKMFGHIQGIVDSLPEYRKEPQLFYAEEFLPEDPHYHFQVGEWLDRYRLRQLVDYRKKAGQSNTNTFREPPLPQFVVYTPNSFCHLRSRAGVEVSGRMIDTNAALMVSNWLITGYDSNGYFTTNFPLSSRAKSLSFTVLTNGKPADRFTRPLVQPMFVGKGH